MKHSLSWMLLGCLLTLVGCNRRHTPAPAIDEVVQDEYTPDQGKAPAVSFDGEIAPLLRRYCGDCHNAAEASGEVVLEGLREETVGLDLALWERAARALRSGMMPPPNKPGPTPMELTALTTFFDAAVFRAGCAAAPDAGRVTLRRLNKTEYNNTIRDLVGLDLRPADDFPADDVGHGFDNVGDVLSVPPLLAEKYVTAAEKVMERVFQSPQARQRLLNPPAEDVVPFGSRGLPPARDEPRKGFRPPPVDPARQDVDHAALVLRVFTDRAYRRPITYAELTRLLHFVERSQKAGEGTEPGLRLALQAVLSSPHFLFKVEEDAGATSRLLNEFELATRLSYFLWSSMPDDELFRLAATGRLRQGQTLENQIRRMLRDPRSAALDENFGGQWLQTRGLAELSPDPVRFSDFDEPLRLAMRVETELFFHEIVRADGSVLDFLDADYTFVNERLAKHYSLSGVRGTAFRRVSLAGTSRGGVVTQAAVLAVTSNPTRTSPVKRGRWVLENLLGSPVPQPPPGADGFKGAALVGTLRQRIEQHRSNPACAGCHDRLDPLGLGLENFDAIGRWRTRDGAEPIDAAGTLPGGVAFRGAGELCAYLRSQKEAFTRCLAEKLLTYALGRELRPADHCAIETAARQLARNQYRFSALILAIAASDPFQRRGASRSEP
jgi:hypothetical protein